MKCALQARVTRSARILRDKACTAKRRRVEIMKALLSKFCLLVLGGVATAVTLAVGTAAQSVEIVATHNADHDIDAVQYAVDHNEHVTLRGHFSFDRLPTVLTALPKIYPS